MTPDPHPPRVPLETTHGPFPLGIALRHVWLPADFRSRDHDEQIAHSLLKQQVLNIGTDLGFNAQPEWDVKVWNSSGRIDVVFLQMGDDGTSPESRIVHAIEIDWLPKAYSIRKLLSIPVTKGRWLLYYREGQFPRLETLPAWGQRTVVPLNQIPSTIKTIHVTRRRK